MDDDERMKKARERVAKMELGGPKFASLEEYMRGQAPDYKPEKQE